MSKEYTAKDSFRVLSTKEEQMLTKDELAEYYKNFRQYILSRKRTNTSPGATTIAPKLNDETVKIAEAIMPLLTSKNVVHEWEGTENIPDGPVLFVHNHQGMLDNFSWIPEMRRHCVLLHGSEVKKFLLAIQLNSGTIGVKKGDKKDNINAKLDEINVLSLGISMFHCPESTWNLSFKPLLPMSRGFVDIAMKARVPIVPVIHEYIYEDVYENGKSKFVITKIISKYGEPVYVPLYETSRLTKDEPIEYNENGQGPLEVYLNNYLDEVITQMATMRYWIIKRKGEFSRRDYDKTEYVKFIRESYKNLRMAGLNWGKETEHIFGAKSEKYAFTYVNEPDINERGDILPHPEIRRLNEIEMKNRIKSVIANLGYDVVRDAFPKSDFVDLERAGYGLIPKPHEKKRRKQKNK